MFQGPEAQKGLTKRGTKVGLTKRGKPGRLTKRGTKGALKGGPLPIGAQKRGLTKRGPKGHKRGLTKRGTKRGGGLPTGAFNKCFRSLKICGVICRKMKCKETKNKINLLFSC